MEMWNPLLIRLFLHHQKYDSEQKRPLSKQFAINLKNVGAIFSRLPICNPFQSYPFGSIYASLSFCCISLMLFNGFSGYCNVSFYFLNILGVMKLHNFAPLRLGRQKLAVLRSLFSVLTKRTAFPEDENGNSILHNSRLTLAFILFKFYGDVTKSQMVSRFAHVFTKISVTIRCHA